MLKIIWSVIFLVGFVFTNQAQNFITIFEQSKGKETATYLDVIDFYRKLDKTFSTIDIQQAGPTDLIHPLHVVYFSKDENFNLIEWKQKNKLLILINNGIHPGEPDGIDASMMLLRDAAQGKINVPENVVLAVIPVFNIGGALNRGSFSRANQNGPKEYGFRGNAQNLDLNRDFIKLDAKETQALVRLFHQLDPDIFIDNHVSNGADYQHVMTLLSVNPKKLGYYTGRYLKNQFEPAIYKGMKARNYDLVPYVNHWGHTPDKGWQQFYEPPRFASGFAALFGTFAFVPETHMLKPYKQRVNATYSLMQTFIEYAASHANEIKSVRKMEEAVVKEKKEFTLDWKVDTTRFTEIAFKGYEGKYKPSEVSGKPRLYYDRNKPFTRQVPFYNFFEPTTSAIAPQAYIIPQGWHQVIERLKMNGVAMQQLQCDSVMELTAYRINNYETNTRPYEGHYLHKNVQYTKNKETIRFLKGDYIISTQQRARRYLIETLEPNAPDAFFAWGFFDAVLQQKEHYSDYVYEETAAELLKNDAALKKQFETKKKADAAFSKDGAAQLDFIYKHSPYYERVHNRYPVFRVE
ncbi:MAG TPA: M14 family metallopeptidase [Flavipsychrobacter sp.]|nr:M14 family metallopeptidase [Flavipsychrobacter sp.]